ncbi:SgrR family transcriptional regulator [Vibrio lentus]|uniref:SgrR family transcriptional regulator n=1 Tax=Vibrio lentus TaxID=136468 RepID=UPI000C850D97|nr:SgrR family transcriptional regulator [Vibrio lentus]PMI43038.1 peptide ABC transporter substrate-binding protein [Vibrio lentus]PMI65118.1 peptide ABC transporter substrate-binding protein [Vibrio lentus]PMJ57846.1 peptide ABC transporter substrate-binding protein [Vibrio lentus]PMM94949.1 peptide ABC transporter substrate-binding protein [Vibrio lentus]
MANQKRQLELYEQIFQAFGPGTSRCQISQLAALLFVSERHVQTIIKTMVREGWVEWQASSGRNKKALLTCLVEPIDACYTLVRELSDAGSVEQMLPILSFGGRDAGLELQSFLSHANQAARRAYIPFHRKLEQLHPHKVLRRTERFLVSQVCQRLTYVENNQVRGDLAYHWQSNEDATVWRFQIRNDVHFHDGSLLLSKDIVRCLQSLTQSEHWRLGYQHIAAVVLYSENTVEVRLSETDWHLPRLLSRAEASIFQMSTSGKLNGSGAFSLDVFSENMLRLTRNKLYLHDVSILNSIELWVYPEWATSKVCAENKLCLEMPEKTSAVPSENYSTFLKIQAPSQTNETTSIMTVEDTSECQRLFTSLASPDDRLVLIEYGNYTKIEGLVLCSIIDEGEPLSAWLSFLSRFPFSTLNLDSQILETIRTYLSLIRQQPDFSRSRAILDECLQWLSEVGIVTELKHEAFGLEVSERIQGVQVNGFGWCELNKLWILDS